MSLRARLATTAHSTAQGSRHYCPLKAEVKRLLIGHYSSRYTDVTPLLDDMVFSQIQQPPKREFDYHL